MCIGVSASSLTAEPLKRFEYSQVHMGGEVKLSLYAVHEETAEAAAKAAFARFAELEQVMSNYRPSSEVRQLSTQPGKKVKASADLMSILAAAQRISKVTDGAFDATAAPVIQLWRQARETKTMPDVRDALKLVGYEKLKIDSDTETVLLETPGMHIDLGGIGKGYACDEAMKVISDHFVFRALIEAGGDMLASGPPPGTRGWSVAVRGLDNRTFNLAYGAISTSGDASQFVEIDGKRYSHIVDPRTGMAVTSRIQATAFSQWATVTDASATALCVGGRGLIEPLRTVGLKDAILIYGD